MQALPGLGAALGPVQPPTVGEQRTGALERHRTLVVQLKGDGETAIELVLDQPAATGRGGGGGDGAGGVPQRPIA